MKPSDLLQYVVAGVIVGLILLLLVTQLLGQPAIVFVETGSMAPTLEPNDGYLAVPAIVAGDPEVGDVILFQSQNLGGGELTTHRIDSITDEGYITKGDANPFTDQSSDEPPVSSGQVRAVALQLGGDMVVIPGLGASVGAIRSAGQLFQETVLQPVGIDAEVTTLSTWAMIVGLILFIYGTVTNATDRHQRSRSRGSVLQNAVVVIAILALVVIIPVNVSMLVPSGVYQYEILSSESPSANEQIIDVGGTSEVTYAIRNSGYLPVLVFLEPASDGVTINQPQTYVPRRSTVETSITMQAPDRTGSYLRFVREYRYLVVLPPSLIASLHAVHPILAIAAINFLVGGLVIVVFVGTVGTDRLRFRSRNRELELGDEIRRMLPAIVLPNTPSGPNPGSGSSGESRRSGPRPPPTDGDTPPTTSGGRKPTVKSGPTPQQPPAAGSAGDPSASPEATTSAAGDVSDTALLDEKQLTELRELLQQPPETAGIDADSWTPQVVQRYIVESYDRNYPLNRCVKLLTQARTDRGDAATQPAQPSATDPAQPSDGTEPSVGDDTNPNVGDNAELQGSGDIQTPAASDSDSGIPDRPGEAEAPDEGAFEKETFDEEFTDEDGGDFAPFTETEYLTDTQLVAIHQALQEPPAEADIAATSWTPRAIEVYIEETYGIEYPMDRCERLVERAADDLQPDEE